MTVCRYIEIKTWFTRLLTWKGRRWVAALLLLTMVSCDHLLDVSPYAIDFDEDDRQVNAANIDKLYTALVGDTLRIAFTGDSHNHLDELQAFVDRVNLTPEQFDLVIHVGDLADFGLPIQYHWSRSILKQLMVPCLVTVGNHDLVGNGISAWETMYGDMNYTLIKGGLKLIFLNTNGLEYGYNGEVPDMNWLARELEPFTTFDRAIVIMHVPPGSEFDPAIEQEFLDLLSGNDRVMMAVHGHLHHQDLWYPAGESLPFLNVYGTEHHMSTVLSITPRGYELGTITF